MAICGLTIRGGNRLVFCIMLLNRAQVDDNIIFYTTPYVNHCLVNCEYILTTLF